MNRQTYLSELAGQLKAHGISDIDEIIAEYDEHFSRKAADGFSEEEISAKLGKPKDIAVQFAYSENPAEKKTGKVLISVGLFFADLFTIPFFIMLLAWVVALGAASIAFALSGVSLFIRPLLPTGLIYMPAMPYAGGAVFGLMLVALGFLAASGTIYSSGLTIQMTRAYKRWHKNMFGDMKYPPYSMHPVLEDRLRRRLRTVALIALLVFAASFIIGYILLATGAGALEFWHVWHWFE